MTADLYKPATLVDLYYAMLTARILEDKLQKLCDDGLAGDLHFNKGQEAISIGVCHSLHSSDHIVTHHRTIAHQIARGAELYPLVAELLGKKTGVCGGRAGEMHMSNERIRHDFSFQLVGTCIPVAAGLAWALRHHHGRDEIVTVFFGDASTSNGQFHEGLNIASIQKVPLLLICENNELAGNILPKHYMPRDISIKDRAAAFGIPTRTIDGNDVVEVAQAAREEAGIVRLIGRPRLIECRTTRLCWHKQGQRDVRSPEVLAKLAERDPLLNVEKRLPPDFTDRKEEMVIKIRAEVDAAISKAMADEPAEV